MLLRCFCSKLACAVGLPHFPEILVPEGLRQQSFGSVVSLGLGSQTETPEVTVHSLLQAGIEDALTGKFNASAAEDILRAKTTLERDGHACTPVDIAYEAGAAAVQSVSLYAHGAYTPPHQETLQQKYAFDYMVGNMDPNIGNILLVRTGSPAEAIAFIDTQPGVESGEPDEVFFSKASAHTGRSGISAAQAFARAVEVPFAQMAQQLTDKVIDETARRFIDGLQKRPEENFDPQIISEHATTIKARRDRAVRVTQRFAG